MRNLIRFIRYLAPSWEGEDGKFSYRRASQFVFIFLIAYMIIEGTTLTNWGFWTFMTLILAFLLLAGMITAGQIIAGIKGLSGGVTRTIEQTITKDPPNSTIVKTEETITPQKAVGEEGG
jgi:hypothetical protein